MQGGVAHASENGSYVYIMLWQSDLLANLWSAGHGKSNTINVW